MKKHFRILILAALLAGSSALSITLARGQNTLTPIYAIQGASESTPLTGKQVTFEGIVIGDFQGPQKMAGFFVQDAKGDGDEKTSDGIFVHVLEKNPASKVDVRAGQLVRVVGIAEEYKGATQIDGVSDIKVLDKTGVTSTPVAPVELLLPLAQGASLESLEGMLVTIPTTLTVTGNYNLERFGELGLASNGRLFAPTNGNGQSKDENARRLILLDDGSVRRNPQPVPYLDGGETRRIGDTVSGLTGVLAYAYGAYRIEPTEQPFFARLNARPLQPILPNSGLKVSGFNVHNYWTTLKSEQKNARGATTPEEFAAQSAKVVTALKSIDADVFGLMEMQNNGDKAVNDLLVKLNSLYGGKTYEAVPDPVTGTGSDLIKCAIIYKPAKVERLGESISDPQKTNSRFPIAQTFRVKNSGAVLTIVTNHLKSKGSCSESVDLDSGQGCWNGKRTEQAKLLLNFITSLQNTSGDSDVLAIGDFNSYMEEDPIHILKAGGLQNLNALLPVSQQYSTQFEYQSGFLDYAFATSSLRAQIAGATVWHINADEPETVEESVASEKATPYRSSDHDPIIVALRLRPAAAVIAQR